MSATSHRCPVCNTLTMLGLAFCSHECEHEYEAVMEEIADEASDSEFEFSWDFGDRQKIKDAILKAIKAL